MLTIKQFDLSILPENAQIELYDFYLFLKQRYTTQENTIKSNSSTLKIENIFPRKLENIKPLSRDEIYE